MMMWSGIEACASVICANLPSYAPLLRWRTNKSVLARIRTVFSTRLRLESNSGVLPKESSLEEGIVGRRPAVGNQARGIMELSLELGEIGTHSISPSTWFTKRS